MKKKKKEASRRSRSTGIRFYSHGIRDGTRWRRKSNQRPSSSSAGAAAQRYWSRIIRRAAGGRRQWPALLRDGNRYVSGFWRGAGVRGHVVPVPLKGTAAAVLYAPRRARTLLAALRQLRRLPLQEIVVVLQGDSPSHLIAAARSQPNVILVFRPDLTDPDIGRALGVRLTKADTVLFIDGERPARAESLARFVWACDNGLDVALNDISGLLGLFHQRKNVYRLAEFLNRSLNRRDLRASSLSTLPYALSRRALDKLGPGQLALPAKAHAIALYDGLRVGTGGFVRPSVSSAKEEEAWMNKAAYEHAEAWRAAIKHKGNRLLFPDTVRNRSLLEEWI